MHMCIQIFSGPASTSGIRGETKAWKAPGVLAGRPWELTGSLALDESGSLSPTARTDS